MIISKDTETLLSCPFMIKPFIKVCKEETDLNIIKDHLRQIHYQHHTRQ